MPSQKFQFPGADGQLLAAVLDMPAQKPLAFALFAHCFTCGKDVLAARRVADALVMHSIAVLRFDFTGLGASEGEFANSHFSSNVADLVKAADHLRATHQAPALLIGHSLGGAAVLAAAESILEAKLVATIAAPADPEHVTGLFRDHIDTIRNKGEGEVQLAGRPFRIKRAFLEDVANQRLTERIHKLRKALLVFHSPTDNTVGIDNASEIFLAAKHPKSFIALPGADHLLSQKKDSAYVAGMIATWAMRYLDAQPQEKQNEQIAPNEPGIVTVQETRNGKFQQLVSVGAHRLIADEPVAVGGNDTGPGPYDYLLAGLGACTSMTMRMYAERKALPVERITVTLSHKKIHAADCEECETRDGKVDRIERVIAMEGQLDAEQRAKLMEIADKCPVHRTLESEISIVTRAGG